jgi:aminoglycoside 6'-N-acetyltransferase
VADSDLPAIVAVLSNPEVARWWGDYDIDSARDELLDDPRIEALTVELEGEVIGVVEIIEEKEPDYRHVGLDIAIASSHHDKGLGREALGVVIEHLAAERGHHRFTIDPATGNERAIRCYTAVGFRTVGVMHMYERAPDGSYRDGLLMELIRDPVGS